MLKTLDAINRPPKDGGLVSNSLVYRYDVQKSADGLTSQMFPSGGIGPSSVIPRTYCGP